MSRKKLLIVAGLAAVTSAWPVIANQPATVPAPDAATSDERLFRMNDYFYDRWEESDGTRIQLGDPNVTFILPRLPRSEQAAYIAIFEAAQQRGVAIWVRFDGTAGRLSADGSRVEFPLCAIEVEGAAYGSVAANCPERPPKTTAGERMLALGLASRTEHRDRALALLRVAAEANDLSTAARAMALRARGYLGLDQALRLDPDNPNYDRILVEALGDFRRVAELDPDDVEAQFGIARALADLGAYDEALAAYESLGSEGDSGYRAAIASGAIHRLLGDYEAALRPLDEIVRREGPQEGMRFNYHRGWTLNLLGRYAEAIDAFTEGLRSQADYPYALIKRSCAFAQLGRHHEALEDQERALEMLRSQAASDPAPWSGPHIAYSEAAVRRLRDAVAGGQQTPIAEICEEPDDGLDRQRARSPMLPPLDR